jgi:hypothetical protein
VSASAVKLYLAVIAIAALGVLAPSAAAAQSPAAYRAELNRHCRTFTPKFKRIEADLKKAVSTKDPKLLAYALGQGLALNLKQDAYIERVQVPAAMRTEMVPTLRLLRTVDRHARRALLNGNNGNGRGFMTEVEEVNRLVPMLNKRLDRAGLRDCGSNQA